MMSGTSPLRSSDSDRLPLAALALAMLLPSLGTSIANVALPTLAAAFMVTLMFAPCSGQDGFLVASDIAALHSLPPR